MIYNFSKLCLPEKQKLTFQPWLALKQISAGTSIFEVPDTRIEPVEKNIALAQNLFKLRELHCTTLPRVVV